MGMENILLVMGGDFEFYFLQLKIAIGMVIRSQNFQDFSQLGYESLMQFSNEDEIQGYFSLLDYCFQQEFNH